MKLEKSKSQGSAVALGDDEVDAEEAVIPPSEKD